MDTGASVKCKLWTVEFLASKGHPRLKLSLVIQGSQQLGMGFFNNIVPLERVKRKKKKKRYLIKICKIPKDIFMRESSVTICTKQKHLPLSSLKFLEVGIVRLWVSQDP